jgi:hypothetical protein
MHQQLWGYKVEEKLYVGVREQKRLNTTGTDGAVSYATPEGQQPLGGFVRYVQIPVRWNVACTVATVLKCTTGCSVGRVSIVITMRAGRPRN